MKPKKTKCCEKCSWTKSGMCLKKSCECHCPDKQTKCKNPMCGKRLNDTDQTMFCPIHRPDQKDEGVKDKAFFADLERVLDQEFPKGKCKERGAALVLFAYANMYHNGFFLNPPTDKEKGKLALINQ